MGRRGKTQPQLKNVRTFIFRNVRGDRNFGRRCRCLGVGIGGRGGGWSSVCVPPPDNGSTICFYLSRAHPRRDSPAVCGHYCTFLTRGCHSGQPNGSVFRRRYRLGSRTCPVSIFSNILFSPPFYRPPRGVFFLFFASGRFFPPRAARPRRGPLRSRGQQYPRPGGHDPDDSGTGRRR